MDWASLLFSQAKYITTDLRNRLSSENLKKILFVHENLPLIGYNYSLTSAMLEFGFGK
jgi:hypothetical protein